MKILIFSAFYIGNVRLIDNFNLKRNMSHSKKDKNPITSVIVVTKTLDANAGSIFTFFNETGTKIPNKPATIIFKTIDIPINKESFVS